ncbi:MAG: hypothetical protein Ct9H300mP23_00890 [Nitrospinota bacterium]|nr:MAG: hypothetical protein Ct9H300mP23_00890 [Nitrospinota bacterium]
MVFFFRNFSGFALPESEIADKTLVVPVVVVSIYALPMQTLPFFIGCKKMYFLSYY